MAALPLTSLIGAGLACAPARTTPRAPEVLDEAQLFESLRPGAPCELVLASFWATWCSPCLAEMPTLVALAPELAEEHVRLVAVSIDLALPAQVRTVEQLDAFARHRGYTLPPLAFTGNFEGLSERHGLPGGPPFHVLYGPEGELGRIDGAARREELEALVARARQ